jgi:hypothetical protein
LPLYPYGRRRTLIRGLIPDRVWSFEQLQGIWYVAVPIRMTVLKVGQGLLLYAPVAPTREVLAGLRELEERHGPVHTIIHPTASGLEHKLPVPAMARAFPAATVWVSPHQWSYPLRLPSAWLGFPPGRTRVLLEDGLPFEEELHWLPLGPLVLGLGTFMELTCLDRATGALLLTDALVSIPTTPPEVFALDPTPLLFHARDRGDEPLIDSPERRLKGWKRLALFANYLRPRSLEVPPLAEALRHCLAPGCRDARSHFGFYPFRWQEGWQEDFNALMAAQDHLPQVAAVLERLVFPRQRQALVSWLREVARQGEVRWLIGAHYEAPLAMTAEDFDQLADQITSRPWARNDGPWATLAGIDDTLLKLGLVPDRPLD